MDLADLIGSQRLGVILSVDEGLYGTGIWDTKMMMYPATWLLAMGWDNMIIASNASDLVYTTVAGDYLLRR